MNYADEIERAGEEFRRRSAVALEDLEEAKQATAASYRAAVELALVEEHRYREEHAEELEAARAEFEEAERRAAETRQEEERLEAEAREQREAIARSIAARKANDVVTPVDEDDDPEGEYYRRKSWLI
ncbi:hypothetical protein ACFQZZ_30965 [Nocardia sp. GCM10030253]|uniref:hypothetical protein n=1 Tax=Nocardia sp. GCM10030253 TaxID=3273404 RepID=UPI00362C711A